MRLEGFDDRQNDDGNNNQHWKLINPAEKYVIASISVVFEVGDEFAKINMVNDENSDED